MRGKPYSWYAFFILFPALLILLHCGNWVNLLRTQSRILGGIELELRKSAVLLINAIQDNDKSVNFDGMGSFLEDWSDAINAEIVLFDANGVVRYHTAGQDLPPVGQMNLPGLQTGQNVQTCFTYQYLKAINQEAAVFVSPFVPQDNGRWILMIYRSDQRIANPAFHPWAPLPFMIFLALVWAGGLSFILAWPVRKFLGRVHLWTRDISRNGLRSRLRSSSVAEYEAVALELNNMADILDQKLQTILQHLKELESVFSSMKESVLAIDNDGTILDINDAACRLLGVESAEYAEGRGVTEVFRKPDLLDFINASLEGRTPQEGEIFVFTPSGDNQILSAHATPLFDPNDHVIGILVVLHDVTRVKQLENMRRDFVGNVSHELRTPITSIKGFVETLLDGAIHDEANAERFLKIVMRHINRLSTIIEDLLALSRIEKSREDEIIELEHAAVRPVLRAAMEMCDPQAQEKNLHVHLHCEADLHARMKPHLVEQAIVNLTDNAVKYSEEGGNVWIEAIEKEGMVEISVRDEGIGIEEKHLTRIFERFYRVDKARSRALGGTGLGLAIVKHIALAHHGDIRVESTAGKGSCFTLSIPLA